MANIERAAEGLRVLIVDDSSESVNLLRAMLGQLKADQIYTAKDGKEALDFLGLFDDADEPLINVILCDWNMPRMSGIDLLRQIRTADPDIPFVMVTGNVTAKAVLEAKSAGISAYLGKPFSMMQLSEKLAPISQRVKQSGLRQVAV